MDNSRTPVPGDSPCLVPGTNMDNGTEVSVLASQSLNDAVKAILNATPRQWLPYALGLLLGYPILASSLRYRRLRNMHKKYPYATREDMAKMTDDHAFEIQKTIAQLEFPFMFIKSLQFALFRVRSSLHPYTHIQSTITLPSFIYPFKSTQANTQHRLTASPPSRTSSLKQANSLALPPP